MTLKRLRPPDIHVITERGKWPAYIVGVHSNGLLVCADQGVGVFLINPLNKRLVTFAGTELDLFFESTDSEVWNIFSDE